MKKYLKYIAIVVLLGGIYGYYMYNKPHKDLARLKADFELGATELFSAYEANEEKSNELYLDKVVEVKGTIKSIKKEEGLVTVTLDANNDLFGVICGMEPNAYSKLAEQLKSEDEVTLRGFCTGMLMDVVLERCVVVSD